MSPLLNPDNNCGGTISFFALELNGPLRDIGNQRDCSTTTTAIVLNIHPHILSTS